ncbi:MAG: DUF418 domain-containing protein [Verrucomicrobiaceae bacterium]|nr:MAG: DUF418 domain-containing protein [Verrucomicrobiaceae bacterium]
MTPPHPSMERKRIAGFDVARALAVLGMTVVHFNLVMTDGATPRRWSAVMMSLLDGRPAALFMMLAGMGMSLLAAKADTAGGPAKTDAMLRRRGLLLLLFGFLNLMIWEGDILRVYGVSLLAAPWLLRRSARTLLTGAGCFAALFCLLFLLLDYSRNWNWSAMKYHGLWTVSGAVRNLFFDGFRAVFPWTGLLILGLWLGRLDWSRPGVARTAVWAGLGTAAATALASGLLLGWTERSPQPGLDRESAVALFGLLSMPPLPLFLFNAGGCALAVTGASVLAAERWRESLPVRALAATGRMAFTWYIAHIVLGLGGVVALGWTESTPGQALAAAGVFLLAAMAVSLWWTGRFAQGPLEFLLRAAGGGR